MIGVYENTGTSFVDHHGNIFNVSEALRHGGLDSRPNLHSLERFGVDWCDATPNLTLNARNATMSVKEIWLWAFIGILLQAFAITFAGLATYHWGWGKAVNTEYGYPCFVTGTILLILDMAMCGHIIEGVTTEYTICESGSPSRRKKFFTLQQSMAIGDQRFPSCAVFFGNPKTPLRVSRRNDRSYG